MPRRHVSTITGYKVIIFYTTFNHIPVVCQKMEHLNDFGFDDYRKKLQSVSGFTKGPAVYMYQHSVRGRLILRDQNLKEQIELNCVNVSV